jgi:valyl-tRNA synthetase
LKKSGYNVTIMIMEKELPKTYDPQKVEDGVYAEWEKSGYFNPDKMLAENIISKDAKPFSIALPPPNVTGTLHIGHSVMLALQDILARYHRMQGDRTLWLPGTDHAAIATQEKVERDLFEKTKQTRHDLGREKFLQLVDEFAKASHDTIVNQMKKMGASVDWSREAFTLDEKRSLAVRTAFKKMYGEGIIYRGARIINWDPVLKTTVSDDEVERKTEKTTFYYLQYGPFVISTARPETKFGDKYVVVHPKDKRYAEYKHGHKFDLEWINGPVTATIIKDEAIDMDFGTGAMTITPWHDAVDFEIAERHKLDKEQVIDFEGNLMPIAGEFVGQNISEARAKIVAKLENKGLVVEKDEDYVHDIAINSRGGEIIEPQIKEQWFICVNKEFKQGHKKTTLKKLMQEAVRSKKIEIIPKHFEKIYFHWIDNLRDWCISRQIWYGHQIPVWYKGDEIYVDIEPPTGNGWTQDPDTLDTWFSSGLWTFSTLGWPNKTNDLENYHPTSVMETGYDILFFWVARMILMSEYLVKEIPFEKVYLHGLVRDEQGRKMSKSLGNIIDPLDVAKKYGTDAVRLSLIIGNTPGNDLKLNDEKIGGFRNFTNKLWNISRYVLMNVSEDCLNIQEIDFKDLNRESMWILQRLDETIHGVTENLNKLNFSLAGEILKDFTWNTFADWYLELSKVQKNEKVLIYVLKNILKLWHPFMPFVTESIWKNMGQQKLLMIEKWPEELNLPLDKQIIFDTAEVEIEMIKEIITRIRNLKSNYNIPLNKNVDVTIISNLEWLKDFDQHIGKLAGTNQPKYPGVKSPKPAGLVTSVVAEVGTICLNLESVIDIEKENKRLNKEADNLQKFIAGLEKRLNDKHFTGKAPENIINQQKETLEKSKLKLQEIENHLSSLS